jgi:ABC-type Fe3+/spermidine/putrescine transport system ATPase subunit
VINRGQCVQCDAPERLYKRPRRRFVAEFFRGCNVLEAELAAQGDGAATYRLAGIGIDVPLGDVATAGRHVALRAENVHLGVFAQRQPCRLSATLLETTFRGTVLDYRLALPDGQTLTATMTQHLEAAPGSAVELGFSPQAVIALED